MEKIEDIDLWIAYCAFHLADYKRAMDEYEHLTKKANCHPEVWNFLACCYFFLGMYKEADEASAKGIKQTFIVTLQRQNSSNAQSVYISLNMVNVFYKEIFNLYVIAGGPKSALQNRLAFHLSHKFNDEKRLMSYHQNLRDVIEDQLSLASIHYLRSHYQEAIDIYKRILLDNR